jgi:alginate O-acetyltransferase complex protein AlgI
LLFPTIDFAIFFVIVFTGNWLLAPSPRLWKLFIVAASYFFYAWADWRYVFLLAASTLVNAAGGRLVHGAATEKLRRFYLVDTVVFDLGLLAWFKYSDFAAATVDNLLHRLGVNGTPVPLVNLVEPVAISFFTFMAISYVVDIYRGRLAPAPFADFAVYLSFFPHLLSGPIVRGSELLPQISRSGQRDPRRIEFPQAAFLIFGGLFKKVVISSYVSSAIVQPVFNSPHAHAAPEILLAAYGYAVQIYCDFSGYTDIAIGCALLLGFRFPKNFDAPYSARNMQDFWRRWHITLSTWLRDYLYIPLGGSRGSRSLLYRNLMITMVLGGLWHGAAWTFVLWGAWHGAAQCIGHWRRQRRVQRGLSAEAGGAARIWIQRLVTFQIVCLGWILFNASSIGDAFTLIGRLFTTWGKAAPLVRWQVIAVILGALAAQYVPADWAAKTKAAFGRLSPVFQGVALACALLVITELGPPGVAPFIYYRF